MDSAGLHQGATQRFEEISFISSPGSMFGHLARASRNYVLVTLATTLSVKSWPHAIRYRLHLLKNKAVIVKRAECNDIIFVNGLETRALLVESVGKVVKTHRGLG